MGVNVNAPGGFERGLHMFKSRNGAPHVQRKLKTQRSSSSERRTGVVVVKT